MKTESQRMSEFLGHKQQRSAFDFYGKRKSNLRKSGRDLAGIVAGKRWQKKWKRA